MVEAEWVAASALTASRRNGNLAQGWPLQGKQSKGAATSTAKQLADRGFAAAFAAWPTGHSQLARWQALASGGSPHSRGAAEPLGLLPACLGLP